MINHQKFRNLNPCESNNFFLYQHDLLNHVQFSEIKERLNLPSHKRRKRDAKWITLTVASFIGIFLVQGCFLLIASWKTTVSKTLSPRTPPKISIRNFSFNISRKWNFYRKFDREWAGNDHFYRMDDPFGIWRNRPSLRFYETVYQFRVQGTLAKNCQSATQLLEEKRWRNC